MGMGSAKGENKAQIAAIAAISSPLLETSISGAMGVLVSITASEDIQLDEIETASQMIYDEAHPDANIIWGAAFDPSLEDEMRVTIIATGFDHMKRESKPEVPVRDEATMAAVEAIARNIEAEKPAPVVEEPKAQEPVYKPAPAVREETIVTKIPARESETETFGSYDDLFKCIKKTKR